MAKKPESKQKKQPGRGGGGGGGGLTQFRDLTAERDLNNKLGKAEKLAETESFDEALEILVPLTRKYPNREEVWELTGVCYAGLGDLEAARDAFESALHLAEGQNRADSLSRYNLANMYALTGFPLLGYEQFQWIDWPEVRLQVETPEVPGVNAFKEITEQLVKEMAAGNQQSQAEFLKYALPLERGQLALARQDTGKARAHFQQALEIDPAVPYAYNNLAITEELDENLNDAIAHYRFVLDKLEPHNLSALTGLARVLLLQGQRGAAEEYLGRLRSLPVPEPAEEVLKLAEIYAIFEEDQAVYDLLRPVVAGLKPPDEQDEDETDLDPELYEQLVMLEAVAAAHLGRPDEARGLLALPGSEAENELLARTRVALEDNEEGPRPGGRFFYLPPSGVNPGAFASFEKALQGAMRLDSKKASEETYRTWLQPYLAARGQAGLEILLFSIWVSDEPLIAAGLMTQLITSGHPGGVELVRHLSFSRVGSDAQRVVGAAVLVQEGLLAADEPVKLWLGGEYQTGTIDQLSDKLATRGGGATSP